MFDPNISRLATVRKRQKLTGENMYTSKSDDEDV